ARLRPERGGGAAPGAAGPAAGARGDTEHRPAVHRDGHRAGVRTAGRAAAPCARRAGADPRRVRQRVLRRGRGQAGGFSVTAAEAESLLDLASEVAVAAGRLLIGSGGRAGVGGTTTRA